MPLSHDVILGKPWLSKFQPSIDWVTHTVSFTSPTGHPIVWKQDLSPSGEEPPLSANQLSRILRKPESMVYLCIIKDTNLQEFHQQVTETTHGMPDYLPNLLRSYEDVFSGVTGLPPPRSHDHQILLEQNAVPPYKSAYHMSQQELDLLRTELQRLTDLGHIQRSTSPFGSPVFFVLEKTGKIRMVTNYRALNKVTIKNRAALPNISELIDQLKDAWIFTKIDLQSGFHLIRMAEEDCHKTAIVTKYGHYKFLIMPFGLCNAPATFQATMNDIFRDQLDKSVIIYIDDLLVYSKSHEEHRVHLQQVLEKMQLHQLCARVHKCCFLQEEVDYLGFIVGHSQVKTDPARIKAIQEWSTPRTVTELHSFLSMTNTFLRFVPMYAKAAAPLTDLLKGLPSKKDTVSWSSQAATAFNTLKKLLSSPSILHIPDSTSPITLHSDYSTIAIGGWIGQEFDGVEKPIAFKSHKLWAAELNYSPYDGELLALIHCLVIFHPYIYGRKVLVCNDQRALQYLLHQRALTLRQLHWLDILMEHNLELKWLPGVKNHIADALSQLRHSEDKATQLCILALTSILPITSTDFIDLVKSTYSNDETLSDIISLLAPGALVPPTKRTQIQRYTWKDNLLWFEGSCLVVPKSQRLSLLHDNHDTPYSGHPSHTILYNTLACQFFWPGMSKDVKQYVKSCDACQRNKPSNQSPLGLLQPLPIPQEPWKSLSTDFISQLPVTP